MQKKSNKESLKDSLASIKKMLKGGQSDLSAPQYLIDTTRYEFTPSFVKHNGRVMSIFKLYVRQGSNRKMSFSDVIDFIPMTTLENVEIHVTSKDMLLLGQEKQEKIKKNSKLGKNALEDSEKYEKEKNVDDKSRGEMRRSQIQDYNDYEMILDSSEPLVVFKWLLIIIADDEKTVDEQIETINTLLDQRHEGARWDSLPGDQMIEFQHLFDEITPTLFDHTSTGSNYAGLSFSLSAGLMDDKGVPIGSDSLSLSNSTAFFDFDSYTRKQAFIAAPRNSAIPRYQKEDELQSPSMSSIAAQTAANQITMAGHRAHHIVLNDFDYLEDDRYLRPAETAMIFDKYDVLKTTVNPLQGFGDIEDRVNIFGRLKQKIVNIFDILSDFELNGNERAEVLEAVDKFYYNQGLWSASAEEFPEESLIVNITDEDEYPTMSMLLSEFQTMSKAAIRDSRENRTDRLDRLYSTLNENMTTYMGILGRTTSIKPSNAPEVYYDFGRIESLKLKQVQLVNLLDYIIHTAEKNDVVIIHGFDQILSKVALMLLDTIKAAQKRGIRFIFTFDSIKSPESASGKYNDMFEIQKSYYTDLDTDVDWSFIGKSMPDEIPLIEKALNQELGATISSQLQSKQSHQVLVHRKIGRVNNFIRLNPII